MSVVVDSSGTQAAVIGTEHTLDDIAAAGVFELVVDTNNMADNDVLELRVYKIVKTGGTRRVCYFKRYTNAQPTDDLIKNSVPVANPLTDAGSLRFTLKQTSGTGRNFDWSVNKLA